MKNRLTADGFGPQEVQKGQKETRRIGLEAPFNWDPQLIEIFAANNRARDCLYPVRVIYSADKVSITGSGRSGTSLPERRMDLREYVRLAHQADIEFHSLWNAPFLGGLEWDSHFQDELRREADALVNAGVDCIVATNPALQHFLRNWHPHLAVGSSVNNHIDSVERARQLIDATGIANLMLDHRNPRNFPLMRALHKAFPSKAIVVLVNESCLRDCALQSFHQASLGAASRRGGCSADPDFCHALCARAKLLDPTQVLRAPWIRPEDIHHVFEAGASLVKLAGRTESTQWIANLVRAYSTGRFEGDVWVFIEKSGLTSRDWETVLGRRLPPSRFHVENSRLDGFIKPFLNGGVPCVRNAFGCGSCRWCENFMGAVTLPANRDERLRDVADLLSACGGCGSCGKPAILQAA